MGKALVIKNVNFSTNALDTVEFLDVPCTGISLSGDTVMLKGDTMTLVPALAPANCTDPVIWSSSDTSVAIVNNGVVTCIGTGTVTITASCGSYFDTLTINCTALTLEKGKVWSTVSGYGSNGARVTIKPTLVRVPYGKKIRYRLSDTNYKLEISVAYTSAYTDNFVQCTTSGQTSGEFTLIYNVNKGDGIEREYDPWKETSSDNVVYFGFNASTNTSPTQTLSDADVAAISEAISINIVHDLT